MKMLIGAFALLIAAPAAAQTAPAADPHAGHGQNHGQHQGQHPAGHGDHKDSGGHSKPMDCCKDGKCCDKAKQQGMKMDCCAKHGEGQAAHKGHDS